jgi:RHS repeat-associated protein
MKSLLMLAVTATCVGLTSIAAATVAGRTAGMFAVDPFGEANYTIPIWAPRGPNGLQPTIALTYNSAQGDGYVGVGWTVSGISAITRCDRTVAQDGTAAAVTGAANDAFCLDGQRLQPTSPYGEGETFQTEVATFQNVIAHGWTSFGPTYFVIQAPNGVQYEYGNTASSAVPTQIAPMAWYLDKVTDTAGNTMTYTYINSNNTAVPNTISWTPASHGSSQYNYTMQFNYIANNAATSYAGYVAGTPVTNTQLLNYIAISSSGTVLKQYNLTYTTPTPTGRNLLASVQECADSTQSYCLLPTTATYQNTTFGLSTSASTALGSGVQNVMTMYDFNNDGIPDLLYYNGTNWYVAFGNGNGYGAPVNTGLTAPSAALVAGRSLLGSHQDGILAQNAGSWWFYSWNGSAFAGVNTGIAVDTAASVALIDVNGDGLPDFVFFYATSGSAHITTRLNTSTGSSLSFAAAVSAFTDPAFSTYGSMFSPSNYFPNSLRSWDFDGDGRQDVVFYGYSPYCQVYTQGICTQYGVNSESLTLLGQQNGTFTAVSGGPLGTSSPPRMINWNNDKCTDIAYGSVVYVSACNGSAAGTVTLAGEIQGTMDVDGDGRTDAIISVNNTLAVQFSTGVGVNPTPQTLNIPLGIGTYGSIKADGSGLDELACLGCTTNALTYYPRSSPGTPPDLLTQVKDGNGNCVQPNYVSISQVPNSHYTPGTDAPAGSGYVNYNDSLYVVGQVTFSDPSTTSGTYQQTYSYADGWQNTQGRGFVGFGSQTVCDSRNGVWETRTYSHDPTGFPLVGMPASDTKYQSANALCVASGLTISGLARTPTKETFNSTLGTQRYFPYSSSDTQSIYEVEVGGSKNGQLITTKVVTYGQPDFYGNFPSITTIITDNDAGQGSWTSAIATQYQTPDLTNWCVNLPSQITVTQSATTGATVTQAAQYAKDPVATTCRNTAVTRGGSNASYNVAETFTFDTFGNISSDSITGLNIARTTTTSWISVSSAGQNPVSVQDPGGAVTQYVYNPSGTVASVTDPNNLLTQYSYDGFGRVTQATRPDRTYTTSLYQDCSALSACLIGSHAVYVTHYTYNADGSIQSGWIDLADAADRPLVTTANLVDGTSSRNEVRYDPLGRVMQQAAPCVWSGFTTPCGSWVTVSHDLRNRVLNVQHPGAPPTAYDYQGRTTIITDSNGHARTLVSDVHHWLRQTTDAAGTYTVHLSYDAAGDKTLVTDGTGATLWQANSYIYGVRPFLSSETDLYRGTWNYTPDALGNITSWTDPKNQPFSATYDGLSRLVSRTEPDLFTQWIWGNSVASANVGQLQSVCTGTGVNPLSCAASPGYSESETYDSLGRLSTRAITIPNGTNGTIYTYGFAYNSNSGLPDTLTYPTTPAGPALRIQYQYNLGVVQSVTDLTDSLSSPLWTANTENPAGQFTQETLGNRVVVNHSFDPVMGWPTSITAGLNGGAALQNESFLFDGVGNLIQRSDNNRGFVENIHLDADDRIDHTTINGNPDMQMGYNANGSIHTRQFSAAPPSSDDYQSPNSLVADSSNALAGGTVTWTSFNQPSIIPGPNNTSSTILYDGNHQRWQQLANYAGSTETTTYIGGLLEKVVNSSGTFYRHYIPGGNSTIMYIPAATNPGFDYFTGDHLASTSTITDGNGNLLLAESFSPWGARRDPNNWTLRQSTSDSALLATTMRHGFTGHEHLDNLAMIDMNGRMYQGAGFMSPDPNLQDLTNTQDYNRYSYARNNPLSYVDPTGFDAQYVCPPSVTVQDTGDVDPDPYDYADDGGGGDGAAAQEIEVTAQRCHWVYTEPPLIDLTSALSGLSTRINMNLTLPVGGGSTPRITPQTKLPPCTTFAEDLNARRANASQAAADAYVASTQTVDFLASTMEATASLSKALGRSASAAEGFSKFATPVAVGATISDAFGYAVTGNPEKGLNAFLGTTALAMSRVPIVGGPLALGMGIAIGINSLLPDTSYEAQSMESVRQLLTPTQATCKPQ